MRKALALVIGSGLLLVPLFAAARIQAGTLAPVGPATFPIEAEWPHYASVGELVTASDVIASVKTSGISGVTFDAVGSPPRTMWEFEVTRALKGDAPALLHASQSGARLPTMVAEVRDDPLATIGATYVLFLKRVTTPSGEPLLDNGQPWYKILGGGQGRLIETDGKLYSLDTVTSEISWTAIKFHGEPISVLEAEVAQDA